MPAHLIDVESTDQHTVKPWFAGHADVSPVVADFAAHGYRLVGGRADYLHHQRAAVVVYQHGAHVINVFSWWPGAARSPAGRAQRLSHDLLERAVTLQYCAVSDAGWDELRSWCVCFRSRAPTTTRTSSAGGAPAVQWPPECHAAGIPTNTTRTRQTMQAPALQTG